MSEEDIEPTNEELRVALGHLAYNHVQRTSAKTCYAASERIFTQAAEIDVLRRRIALLENAAVQLRDEIVDMEEHGEGAADESCSVCRAIQAVDDALAGRAVDA